MGWLIFRLELLGDFWLFSWDLFKKSFLSPIKVIANSTREIAKQIYRIGIESLPIVFLISGFIGMILAIQTAYQLEKFGATAYVSSLVTVSVVRELGPLLTAILISGRIGAGITAELGSMVVNEEITAYETMAIDPKEFLLVPRFVALVVSLPILTLFADILAFLGGMLISGAFLAIPVNQYYSVGMEALIIKDVATGLFKSVVFGFIIALIACYKGFRVRGGAVAVGTSTTQTVVHSIVWIIVADLFLTFSLYFL